MKSHSFLLSLTSDHHYKITMTSVISVNIICLFISLSVWTNNTKKDGYFISPSELFMMSRSAASMLQKIEKHSKHSIQQFSSIPIVLQLLGWIQINFFPKIFYSLLPWLPHKILTFHRFDVLLVMKSVSVISDEYSLHFI